MGLSHDVWAVSEYTVLYKVLVMIFLIFLSLSLSFFFARVSLEVHTVSVSRRLSLVGVFLCSFSFFTLGRVGFSLCRSVFIEKFMEKSEEEEGKKKKERKTLSLRRKPHSVVHTDRGSLKLTA